MTEDEAFIVSQYGGQTKNKQQRGDKFSWCGSMVNFKGMNKCHPVQLVEYALMRNIITDTNFA